MSGARCRTDETTYVDSGITGVLVVSFVVGIIEGRSSVDFSPNGLGSGRRNTNKSGTTRLPKIKCELTVPMRKVEGRENVRVDSDLRIRGGTGATAGGRNVDINGLSLNGQPIDRNLPVFLQTKQRVSTNEIASEADEYIHVWAVVVI